MRSIDPLAELMAAVEPYLPIVRTFVVRGNVVPALRERLIQRIEAGLRAACREVR